MEFELAKLTNYNNINSSGQAKALMKFVKIAIARE
jgi:hypothetical protein